MQFSPTVWLHSVLVSLLFLTVCPYCSPDLDFASASEIAVRPHSLDSQCAQEGEGSMKSLRSAVKLSCSMVKVFVMENNRQIREKAITIVKLVPSMVKVFGIQNNNNCEAIPLHA